MIPNEEELMDQRSQMSLISSQKTLKRGESKLQFFHVVFKFDI